MTTAATSESSEASAGKPPILLKRPCLLIATFLIPGIVIGHLLLPQRLTIGLFVPLAACLSAALLLLVAHSTFSTPASMLVVFWIGILLGVKCGVLPPRHVHFELGAGRMYRLRGRVTSEPVGLKRHAWPGRTSKKRFSFDLEATQASDPQSETSGWRAVRGKVLVYTAAGDAGQLQYGDRVELTGKAFLPDSRRNPGGFDSRKYLAEKGVYVCMRASAVRRHGKASGSPIYRFLYSLKKKIRRSFSESGLGDEEKSFLLAIILGERRGVGEEFKEALRRTNTMHILAISGLHVGIIAGAMYFFLCRLLFVPRNISSLATIVVLFGYAMLTGMRPPVFRASIMCTAFLIAPLLGRRSDSVNSLAFAAVVILFIRPGELFTAGFQLSFMVVLSILLLSDKIFYWFVSLFRLRPDPGFLTISGFRRRIYHLVEYPLRLFSVSLAAFLGLAPLGLHYFHRICFVSPLCNMVVIPLVGFIVPLGFLAGFVGLVAHGAAAFINSMNGELIRLLQTVVTSFPAARVVSFNVHPPALLFGFAFYSLLLLVGFSQSLRRLAVPKILIALVAAGLFLGGELARRHPDSMEITFLDVGQGDCIFIDFPDGRKMLVDGGSTNRDEVGRYVIVPFLRWSGVNRLDAVLITHYDADHVNGLESVLDEVRTRTVVAREGPAPPDTSTVRNLLRAIRESKGIRRLETVQAGDRLCVSPPVEGTILNPSSDTESPHVLENDLSVVLKLGFRGSSALLCGDIGKRAEGLILRGAVSLRGDVLKVPHHGSNSSSSEEFIRHAAPKVGIISCGQNNIYGHPSPKVLDRYYQLGVRLFRTDRDGGIVVGVFKDKLRVATTL